MHLFTQYYYKTVKIFFLFLIFSQALYSSDFHLSAGVNFFMLNYFKGSGPHEPYNIKLKTDEVKADPGFAGFGLKGILFNIKDSYFGAEFGVQYNKSKFPDQDVELSYYTYSASVFQPSFQVNSINFLLGLVLSPLPNSGLIFNKLKPYASAGLSYSTVTVSDVNFGPEYGVGGESNGQGFGYVLKIGTEYLIHKEYIFSIEIFYNSASIHVERFRSFNIDGVDGKFNALSLMILFGKSF